MGNWRDLLTHFDKHFTIARAVYRRAKPNEKGSKTSHKRSPFGSASNRASGYAEREEDTASTNPDERDLAMPVCPRCEKPISATALICSNCQLTLKAHGHPGMTLYRAKDAQPLCATCVYDADDSCTFPKRPEAMTCTLYQDIEAAQAIAQQPPYRAPARPWWKENTAWIALGILIAASVAIALF